MFSEYTVHSSLTSVLSIQSRIVLWADNWTSMLLCGVSWWHRTRHLYLGSFTSPPLFFGRMGQGLIPSLTWAACTDRKLAVWVRMTLKSQTSYHQSWVFQVWTTLAFWVCFWVRASLSGHGYPGTHYAHSAVLELKRRTCFCLQNAGIKGVYHRVSLYAVLGWNLEPHARFSTN